MVVVESSASGHGYQLVRRVHTMRRAPSGDGSGSLSAAEWAAAAAALPSRSPLALLAERGSLGAGELELLRQLAANPQGWQVEDWAPALPHSTPSYHGWMGMLPAPQPPPPHLPVISEGGAAAGPEAVGSVGSVVEEPGAYTLLGGNFAAGHFGEVWRAYHREGGAEAGGAATYETEPCGEARHLHRGRPLCARPYILKRVFVEQGADTRLSGQREAFFGKLLQNASCTEYGIVV